MVARADRMERLDKAATAALIREANAIDDQALAMVRAEPVLSAAFDAVLHRTHIKYWRPYLRSMLRENRGRPGVAEAESLTAQADAIYWRVVMSWKAYAFGKAWKATTELEDVQDLSQDGLTGLYNAALRFDVDRGLSFSTFATHHIRAVLQRRDIIGEPVKVRAGLKEKRASLFMEIMAADGTDEHGDVRAAARRANMDPDLAESLMAAGYSVRLDGFVGDDATTRMIDSMEGDGLAQLEEDADQLRAASKLATMIAETPMSDVIRGTMMNRLGLSRIPKTIEYLAELEGVTRQAIDLRFANGCRKVAAHLGLPKAHIVEVMRKHAQAVAQEFNGGPPRPEGESMEKPIGIEIFLKHPEPPKHRQHRSWWVRNWCVKELCLIPGLGNDEASARAIEQGVGLSKSMANRWMVEARAFFDIRRHARTTGTLNKAKYAEVCGWYGITPLRGAALQIALLPPSKRHPVRPPSQRKAATPAEKAAAVQSSPVTEPLANDTGQSEPETGQSTAAVRSDPPELPSRSDVPGDPLAPWMQQSADAFLAGPVNFSASLHPKLHARLVALVETGLWGLNVAECMIRIVENHIEGAES